MKKLQIIACVTNELRYWWETAVYIHNLTELGYKNINILVFISKGTSPLIKWDELKEKFPLVNFEYYIDDKNIENIGKAFYYKPLYRLWLLQEHFKKHPELEQDAILYTDTDIIFNKYLDFSQFLLDDINYLSWTGNKERTDNYLWQPYFDNKISQVRPDKLEQYKKLDILSYLGRICNTTREQITLNNPNTGGAQYLLKNINSQFWTDCFNTCAEIKTYLSNINQTFMMGDSPIERTNNGLQDWCSDMWGVLYNLWGTECKTSCPKELEFSWSTDRIERNNEVYILHNAGITAEANCKIAFEKNIVEGPMFYKGQYINYTPFDDLEKLNSIVNHPVSSTFANVEYIKAILKTEKYLNGRNI